MKDEVYAAQLCADLTRHYDNLKYEKFLACCRRIGNHLSRSLELIPPNARRMVDCKFDGMGSINVYRTMNAFCERGKKLDEIVGRKRVQDVRVLNLAILYDDSNSMSAWWRSDYLGKKVEEKDSPHSLAKIATLALCESFGKDAKLSLVVYGSGAKFYKKIEYRELVERNGSGATRLDSALAELMRNRWERRGGARYLLILSDGVPEAGNEKYSEDSGVQRACFERLKHLLGAGVRIAYVTLADEKKLALKKLGDYDAESFCARLARMHVNVEKVKSARELGEVLFSCVKKMSVGA
ncbi:MAG: vWA domain-containing protein [Candidatus Micrarchaeota archaeon]